MPKLQKKHVAAGAAGAIALASTLIYNFEGERHTVYRDVIGVATYCIGETKNPQFGHVYSHAECMDILGGRLAEFDTAVRACTREDMPAEVEAAADSLAYNIGTAGFCKSSIARDIRSGDYNAACNAFELYDRAGGRVIAGLQKRRMAERKVCLEGL